MRDDARVEALADAAPATYANMFYLRQVDTGGSVKLTFLEQLGESLAERGSILLSSDNARELQAVLGRILGES